jgi:Flp pilus assembly protein protease CpaA
MKYILDFICSNDLLFWGVQIVIGFLLLSLLCGLVLAVAGLLRMIGFG